MKRIYEIIEEVKNLRGANVKVFGQPTTSPSDYGKYIIDTIDILNNLEKYEAPEIIDYWTIEEDEEGEEEEILEMFGKKLQENSYNTVHKKIVNFIKTYDL